MPNIASVLKTEISRIARKETRSETGSLKSTVSAQRSDIAALKRRVQSLERALKALMRATSRGHSMPTSATAGTTDGKPDANGLRFRAQGMASNRKRLGLSAAEFGMLVGATGQSIYAWESGKSKPRARNLAAIAALRGIGKREVTAQLEALKQAA